MRTTLKESLQRIGVVVFSSCIAIANAQEKPQPRPGGEIWYNGDRAETIWFADDQLYVINGQNLDSGNFLSSVSATLPATTVLEQGDRGTRLQLPPGLTATELLANSDVNTRKNETRYAAVYYTSAIATQSDKVLVQTGELVVIPAAGNSLDSIDKDVSEISEFVTRLKTLMNGTAALYSCPSDRQCLSIANELRNLSVVAHAYPNWLKTRPTRSGKSKKEKTGGIGSTGVAPRLAFNDPLYPDQWHLENTGQNGGTAGEDVNIQSAWDLGYSGNFQNLQFIAIVDDGLEINHEDIFPQEIPGAHLDLVDGDTDPTPGQFDFHGTAVGGIAAALGNNGLGVAGAAWDAGLIGIRLLGPGTTDADEGTALSHNLTAIDSVDIYNNSWGPADNGSLDIPGPLAEAALAQGVTTGRNGNGAIYVWAGGNGLGFGDNSNYDGYANSRYTIAVAASDDMGEQSTYSEPGANLLINTPSSPDPGAAIGTTTTDLTGENGYSSDNYTFDFGGTSSAAPLAAGVIALVLDANAALSWRDVQMIVATTAEINDPSDTDWIQNGAGHWVNHKYGFGRIDATAAVTAALGWSNLPAETSVTTTITPNAAIPQPEVEGGSLMVNIPIAADINIENVYLTLDSDHSYWGDLEITLTSPAGTISRITETHGNGIGNQLNGGFRFSTVRALNENSSGNWTLEITDNFDFDTGSLVSAQLQVFGVLSENTCNGEDVTVYIGSGDTPTSGKDVILGTDNDDTIFAMGGDDIICGLAGSDNINGGRGFDWIDAGDGDDTVQGARDDDIIFGGLGNDILFGGPGADDIFGEEDDDTIIGNTGDDMIDGGNGIDEINGGNGDDIIFTGLGSTVGTGKIVDGAGDNDTITGGPDRDEIRASAGDDVIYGGGGEDRLFGGSGNDEVYGDSGDDFIRGNAGNDMLFGNDGEDNINGFGGKDIIYGGADNDILSGSTGNDTIYGETGDDDLNGGGGNDDLFGGEGEFDVLLGGGGNDNLNGGPGSFDICDGGSGTNTTTECEI